MLTDKAIKALETTGKKYQVFDGDGLLIEVRPNGGRYWKFRYYVGKRRRELSLGVYPEITLKKARLLRNDARRDLDSGIDPIQKKKAAKDSAFVANDNSFRVIAKEWFDNVLESKSEGYRNDTWRAIESGLFSDLGAMPVGSILPTDVLRAIRKLEAKGTYEKSRKLKAFAGRIFRYAIATGRARIDPTYGLDVALKAPVVKHMAALTDPAKVGKLMADIDQYSGTPAVCNALKLSPLLFLRPGELRSLKWSYVKLDKKRIEIPKSEMKVYKQKGKGDDHFIPLSRQALAILEQQKQHSYISDYIFPTPKTTLRPISDNAVRVALRTLGYSNEEMTAHGFRAMARTLLDEELGFRIEWIEHQLAHTVKDANGRAYNRTTYLKQREKMMQVWADYLDKLKNKASSNLRLVV